MKRQYLITERAHFMCPNMHFGMMFEVEQECKEEKVRGTLSRLAKAHPFLKSLIAYEEGTEKLYYKITDCSQITLIMRQSMETLWEDYKEISRQDWNVMEEGLLKVYCYPKPEGMTVLFVAHHLLADGRGLLGLAEEFANDYVGGIMPGYVEEQLIEDIDDLPAKSRLSGISRLLVKQANNQWVKENQIVTYEQFRQFAKEYGCKKQVEYQTYEVDAATVTQMRKQCKENGYTMNDLLMAHMYVTAGVKKIIIASDVRNTLAKYRKGALGNYATAIGIPCKTKTTDINRKAQEVHAIVQKYRKKNSAWMLVLACYLEMNPTLLDAAAISAMGGFSSKAGFFVGESMFGMGKSTSYSITNLGQIQNENMKSVMFIPPASPAARFTLGVVTLNGCMKACSSRN